MGQVVPYGMSEQLDKEEGLYNPTPIKPFPVSVRRGERGANSTNSRNDWKVAGC